MYGKSLCCEDQINMKNQVSDSMDGLIEHSSDSSFSMVFERSMREQTVIEEYH